MPESIANSCAEDRRWLLTIAAFLLSAVIQVGGVFWWASGITSDLREVQKKIELVQTQTARMDVLEQRVGTAEAWIRESKPIQVEFIRAIERLNYLSDRLERLDGASSK